MKAIVWKGPDQVETTEVPKPEVPAGWAMVRVSHAGICGTDKSIYHGFHPRAKAPLIMGHEYAGVLESDDVPGIKKGARVTVYPLLSCGHCTPCREGNEHVCNTLGLVGIDRDGGFAEYTVCPAESIVEMPDSLSMKLGAFIEPVAVTVHALRERNYHPGDNAILFGAGAIGLATACTLKAYGCTDLLLMETNPTRRAKAQEMGFETVDPTTVSDMAEFCRSRTGGDGFDWVIDCAGVQPVANYLFDAVKVHGTIFIIAGYAKPASLPLGQGMFKECSIQFTRVYRRKDFAIAVKLVAEHADDYEKIITAVYSPDDAKAAFADAVDPGSRNLKIMFCFENEEGDHV